MATPINLKFPPRRGVRGAFATNDSTIDAVVDDLRILLLTNFGERPIHYDFGANLRSVLFENSIDIEQQVEDLIRAAIDKWMPFVNIKEILVSTSDNNRTLRPNEINVKLKFFVGQIEGVLSQDIRG